MSALCPGYGGTAAPLEGSVDGQRGFDESGQGGSVAGIEFKAQGASVDDLVVETADPLIRESRHQRGQFRRLFGDIVQVRLVLDRQRYDQAEGPQVTGSGVGKLNRMALQAFLDQRPQMGFVRKQDAPRL